ncbi:MAG TPA: hypothetical protein VMX97_00560, partial [Hyphomicrobiaceae bacterium]|nr:hypothetical protein [Hyphomicrobiaceae bacterium]
EADLPRARKNVISDKYKRLIAGKQCVGIDCRQIHQITAWLEIGNHVTVDALSGLSLVGESKEPLNKLKLMACFEFCCNSPFK